ncbi:MAG: TolC family protein [Acidobacteriota bacterium]
MSRALAVLSFCLFCIFLPSAGTSQSTTQKNNDLQQTLSLSDCMRIAMERNHTRPASQMAVAAAEAQHRQAMAAYWPQVTAQAGIDELSRSPNFLYPASNFYIPSESISVPGGTALVTIPANAFGPGFPPAAIQLPVSFPGQTITTPAQAFPVPAQDVKLFDPTTESVSGKFDWLLMDFGMRSGLRQQTVGGIEAAQAKARRTDLELADSVIRLYYGAVLARQLHQLGEDTLERMEATLRVTEALYKDGTGTVNKTDYLDNKVMVETVRSMVATLEQNEAQAQAGLAYTMGYSWRSTVIPADTAIPFRAWQGNLDEMVTTAYEFNPDWAELEAGLKALGGEERSAESGHYPKLGLKGELHRRWNDYNGGLSTPNNRTGWALDLGVEIPVFDGFLTNAKVAEVRARIAQLKQQKLLLTDGLGVKLRNDFTALGAAEKAIHAGQDASVAAADDRDLTMRAYQEGMVATEKVIRVELQEALVQAALDKAIYDHTALESHVDLVVGRSFEDALTSSR